MFKHNKYNIIKSYYSTNNENKDQNKSVILYNNHESTIANVGNTKHYPPTIRVWNNSVYNYNKNNQDDSLSKYNKLNKLIKSYFNLHNNKKLARSKRMRYRRIKIRSKKLYLSRPEVKQTNDKISITVYYFDKLKHSFIRKIFYYNRPRLLKSLFRIKFKKKYRRRKFIKKTKFLEKRIKYSGMRQIRNFKVFKDRNKFKNKFIIQRIRFLFFKRILSYINVGIYIPFDLSKIYFGKNIKKDVKSKFKKEIMKINSIINRNPKIIFWIDFNNFLFEKIENNDINYSYLTSKVKSCFLISVKKNLKKSKETNFFDKLNFLSQINKKFSEIVNMLIVTNIISKSFLLRAYNIFTLDNNLKFSKEIYKKRNNKISKLMNFSMANIIKFKNLLPALKMLIDTIYNKKIVLNMVNLKYFYLNSDIYTQAIATKLQKKKNPKKFLNKSILKLNVLSYYNSKVKLNNLNRLFTYNKLSIDSFPLTLLRSNLDNESVKTEQDKLQRIYNKIFPQNLLQKYYKVKRIFRKKVSNILNTVKYKGLYGIRLEVKGRLTRRHKAARSLSHLIYKGSLKDTDNFYYEKEDSIKNIPTIFLRNDIRANTQYSSVSSVRRIGSFGLKTWIAGR